MGIVRHRATRITIDTQAIMEWGPMQGTGIIATGIMATGITELR